MGGGGGGFSSKCRNQIRSCRGMCDVYIFYHAYRLSIVYFETDERVK